MGSDDDPYDLYATGNLRLEEKNYSDAIKYFEQAVKVKPDFREARMQLAEAYRGANRVEEAESAYLSAERIPVPSVTEDRIPFSLPWHNPYHHLLPEDEAEADRMMQDLEGPCRDLLNRYHQDRPRGVDYNDPTVQQVYMFRYFPFYIEILPYILNKISDRILDSVFHNGMGVALYGCGPAPELLGLGLFAREVYPEVKTCEVTCCDRAQWDFWRSRVLGSVARGYWPERTIRPIQCREFDLLSSEIFVPPRASILTMQNCCTDLLAAGASESWIRERILKIFEKSSPGSLFILADIAEREIYNLFTGVAHLPSGMGEVLCRPEEEGERHPRSFDIPENVRNSLFTTRNRSGNRFYPLVLRRAD